VKTSKKIIPHQDEKNNAKNVNTDIICKLRPGRKDGKRLMKSMRLFIAILLSDDIKDELCSCIGRLRDEAESGSFTRRENLHLTLAFIGQTERLDDVKRAVNSVTSPCFELMLEGSGVFRRDGGDVFWAGIRRSEALDKLYRTLNAALAEQGLPYEKREFCPHLTLGRQVVTGEGFSAGDFSRAIKPVTMKAVKISVMKSERIAGRLVYTEISSHALGGGRQ
jgi:2'-5' RNA ligase